MPLDASESGCSFAPAIGDDLAGPAHDFLVRESLDGADVDLAGAVIDFRPPSSTDFKIGQAHGLGRKRVKVGTAAHVAHGIKWRELFKLRVLTPPLGPFGDQMTVLAKDCASRQSNPFDPMHSSPSPVPAASVLPYTDIKPVGAADFYVAINATFRFMAGRFGLDGLRRYWTEMGRTYYAPVSARWKAGGLNAVAAHWRAFFAAEPGAEVEVEQTGREVIVEVKTCPAIRHLREHGREIVPEFCQHCYFVSQAIGEAAGMEVRICGGNGRCTQSFAPAGAFSEPQNLEAIQRAS